MADDQRPPLPALLPRVLSRMRHPHLFLLLGALLLVDLVVPDIIPFFDEIVLAILTVLVGSWQRRDQDPRPPAPPALPGS